MALSLRLPSPEVIWHRVLIEPGLSSLVYSTKATNQLSGNRLIKEKKSLNQEFFIGFLIVALCSSEETMIPKILSSFIFGNNSSNFCKEFRDSLSLG